MKEYIERQAVEEFILDGLNNPDKDKAFGHDAIEILAGIHFMLAADVAPVVRCRECKFYNKPRLGWCNFHMDRENQDDFCSYGQRKEVDHETSQHL